MKCFLILVLSVCLSVPAGAEPVTTPLPETLTASADALFQTHPIKKANGQKWRIAYFRGGEYKNYPDTLKAVVKGLQTLGWLTIKDIPEQLGGVALWQFIAKNTQSAYLEFVEDALWQPGDFDESKRAAVRQAILKRLSEKKDVDLILAMGTWAGQDMVVLGAPVPTIVLSTSDPIGSGIIKSPWDSGLDNLNARVSPERYTQQVRLFHDIIPFKKLGLIYENTPEGRTYSALDNVKEVARELQFELVTCEAPFSGLPPAETEQKALDCYRKLVREVDAVYVTVHRGMSDDSIRQAAEILRKAKIPSFSMQGPVEVRSGILMSMAQADFSDVGIFHAETIARVFNGAKPRQLNQIWADPAKIVLNLKVTRMIGFDPPVDILLAADEVYED
jgi:ABC-type uncharacterized transport system substrate-binding protein